MGCAECPLSELQETKYRGDLDAEILFVGESPGGQELREGVPFVGPSGRLLTENIEWAGLDPRKVFFTNSARCMIEKDAMSSRDISSVLDNCRPKLEMAIKEIKPKCIVLCGAIALQQVMRMKGIKKARGKWLWSDEFDCHVMPTWHPAYILRNQSELDNLRGDLTKVTRLKSDGWEFEDKDQLVYREVDTILPLLSGGLMREDGTFLPIKGHRVIRTEIQEDQRSFITAIDTETQGLNWWDPNSVLISYSVAVNTTEAWTVHLHEECPIEESEFTIQHIRGGTKKKPEYVEIGVRKVPGFARKVEELRELCARTDIKKYFANLKYEKHRFYNLGITELNNAPMDVMLAAHTIDSERFLNNTLSGLVDSFTNFSINLKDAISDSEKSDMFATYRAKRDVVNKYACFDAAATLNVGITLRKELLKDEESLNYYINFVHPTECDTLFDMERNGILIDQEKLPEVKALIQDVMVTKISEFKRMCPPLVRNRHIDNFKLTRRRILMEALFDFNSTMPDGEQEVNNYGFHVRPIKISPKTKLPVCDKDALTQLLDNDRTPEKAKELIHIYREWSDHSTLMTRYIKNIEACIGPDGRLHPSYSFKFTSSGRTGARNPSIQNFPKRGETAKLIRMLIIAPPGKILMEADHSMSELRWVAHVANERKMKEIFMASGDIHLTTGREAGDLQDEQRFLQLSPKEVKKIRQDAKAINFGFVYGMSAQGFKNYARSSYHMKLTDRQAQQYREKYFNLYRDLPYWHQDCEDTIRANGYIRALFGRKRILPNIYSPDRGSQAQAIRIGTNFIIQNPSSDATLMGGNNVMADSEFDANEASINIFIHDALIFEIDEDKVTKYAQIIKNGMEKIDTATYGFNLSVPLLVEAEIGNNLSEMNEYSYA
jgi:uracil-DNA glycosylase family 4